MNLGSAHGEIAIDYTGQAAVKQAMADLGSLAGIAKSGQIADGFNTAGKAMMAAGGAISAPLVGASKLAIDFGREMANVNSILQMTPEGIEDLGNQVQALSPVVNKAPAELAAALYDIASSGFEGEEGLRVLEAAAKGANAGLTSTATSARAISSVLNAYNLDATESARVSDVLFQTVNDGVLTYEQLANNMGNTIPIASALGVSIEELGAGYATMTTQGMNASAAETNLAAIMRTALNPTKALTEALEAHGTTAEEIIAEGGLPAYLKFLEETAGGSNSAMFDLLGTQEAMNGVTALGVEEGNRYLEFLENQKNASEGVGATQKAYNEQMEATGFVLDRMKVAIASAGTALGETLEPGIIAAASLLGDLAFAFAELDPKMLQSIGLFGSLSAGMLLIGGGAALAAGKIFELSEAFARAGLSLRKFLVGFGLLGAAIGLGVLAYTNNWLGFGDAVDSALAGAKKGFTDFRNGFRAAFARGQEAGLNNIANGIQAFGDALLYATGIDITGFTDRLSAGIQAFGDHMAAATAQGVSPLVAGLFAMGDAFDAMGLPEIGQAFTDLGQAAANFGAEFAASSAEAEAAGYSETAADIIAFGDALEYVTGLPVEDFFRDVGDAVQTFGDSFAEATESGLNPFDAALNATRDTLESVTDIPLGTFFDDLGEDLTGAREGVEDFTDALSSGDFESAAEQAGGAVQDLGANLQEGLQNASDAAQVGMQALGDAIAQADLGSIAESIGTQLGAIGADLQQYLPTPGEFAEIGTTIGSTIGEGVVNGMQAAGGFKDYLVQNVGPIVQDAAAAVGDLVGGMFDQGITNELGDGPMGEGGGASAILESIKGLFAGVKEAFVAEFQEAFEIGDLPTPSSDFIVKPLQEMVNNAAAAMDGIFAPLLSAVQSAALELTTAMDNLPGVDLTQQRQQLEDEVYGPRWRELSAVYGAEVSEGLDMSANDIAAAYDEANTTVTEAARQYNDDQTRVLEAESQEYRDFIGSEATQNSRSLIEAGADLKDAVIDFLTLDYDQPVTTAGLDFGEAVVDPALEDAQEAVEAPKVGEAATEVGDTLVRDFATAMEQAVTSSDPTLFEPVSAAMTTKVSESLAGALDGGFAGEGGPRDVGPGQADVIGEQLVASLANSMATAVAQAPVEAFAGLGTALMNRIGSAMTETMGEVSTEAPEGSGTIGVGLVTGLASSIASSIAQAPVEAFAGVGTALMNRISGAMTAALGEVNTQGAQLSGSGDIAGMGGGIGESIATNLANSLAASITAAPIESFLVIGEALSGKIQAALSVAMTAAPSALMDSGRGMTGTGQAGANLGGGAEALMVSIATQLAGAITAAPVETFAAVGQALSAKIQEVLSTAFTQGGGGGAPSPGLGGGGGQAAAGIGQALADAIAQSVTQADFTGVTTALQTPLQTVFTEVGTMIATGTAQWTMEFSTGFTNISTVVTNGMTAIQTAVNTGVSGIQASIQAIVPAIDGIASAIQGAMSNMTATISSAFAEMQATVDAAVSGIQASVQAIIPALESTAAAAGQAAAAIGQAIVGALDAAVPQVAAAAGRLAAAAADAIAAALAISSPSKVVWEIAEHVPEAMVGAFQEGEAPVAQSGASLAESLIESIREKVEAALQEAGVLGEQLGSELSAGVETGIEGGVAGTPEEVGSTIPSDMATGITTGTPDACQAATDLGTEVNSCLGESAAPVGDTATGVGSAIPEGVTSGIEGGTPAAGEAAADLGETVTNEAGTAIEENGGEVTDAANGMGASLPAAAAEGVDAGAGALGDSVSSMLDQGMSVAEGALEQARSLFEQYGMTFGNDLGSALNESMGNVMGNANLDRLMGLGDKIRANVEERTAHLRDMGDRIRERYGLMPEGEQTITVESTGSVMMDEREMGQFSIQTVIGSLQGAQRKGGRRMGRQL